jgi:hypothetical protein
VVIDRTTDPFRDRETWIPSTLPTGIAAGAAAREAAGRRPRPTQSAGLGHHAGPPT